MYFIAHLGALSSSLVTLPGHRTLPTDRACGLTPHVVPWAERRCAQVAPVLHQRMAVTSLRSPRLGRPGLFLFILASFQSGLQMWSNWTGPLREPVTCDRMKSDEKVSALDSGPCPSRRAGRWAPHVPITGCGNVWFICLPASGALWEWCGSNERRQAREGAGDSLLPATHFLPGR